MQNAAKLPSEFVLDLDFEDIELVEKGSARPLIPVTALSTKCLSPFIECRFNMLTDCQRLNAENREGPEADGPQAGMHASAPRNVLHVCESVRRRGVSHCFFQQVVDALHAASTDERVKGVIAHIGSTQNFSGMAQIQELRDAVMKFRSGRLQTIFLLVL